MRNLYRYAETEWLRAEYKNLLDQAAEDMHNACSNLAAIALRAAKPIARELDHRSKRATR